MLNKLPLLLIFLLLSMDYLTQKIWFLIVFGFNDTSNPSGSFCVVSRQREKRDRRDSRGDERGEQGRKRKMNESEET